MLEQILEIFMGGDNLILSLVFYSVIIALYSVFVFFFYRFLARKDIISLNLNQYNHYSKPGLVKFFAALFYIIEYIVLLPVVTFFWFAVLAILILVLSESMEIATVLLISAALIGAVRITSYVSENLSQDLAKMVPFGLVSVAITSGVAFFDASSLTSRIAEIPLLFDNIPYYLIFIAGIEISMRILGFLFSSLKLAKSLSSESVVTEEMSEIEN